MTELLPLGDQAALAYFADESAALRFAAAVRRDGLPWLVDVVQAYASVAVFFEPDRCDFAAAADNLRRLAGRADQSPEVPEGRSHVIPCCYERGPDLARVAERTGLSADDVIRRHAAA